PRQGQPERPDCDHVLLGQVLLVGLGRGQSGALGQVDEGAHAVSRGRVSLGPLQVLALVLLQVVALAVVVLHHQVASIEFVVLVEQVDVGTEVGQVLVVGAGGGAANGGVRSLLFCGVRPAEGGGDGVRAHTGGRASPVVAVVGRYAG